jgi:tetratricopeptide (TPR) repeat protein
LRAFVVSVIFVAGLIGSQTARGQADISVELNHIQRLSEEGRWVEGLDETGRLMQGMAKQMRAAGPSLNAFYSFAVLRSRFAVGAGDLQAAEKAIKEADGVASDMAFRRMLAAMAPPDLKNDDAKQQRREFEANILMRDFALDDAKTMLSIVADQLDEAETLVNANFQRRRNGGGGGRLLAVREKNKQAVVSPQGLAALSTFEPSRMAALLYVKRKQFSRARSYLLDAQKAAAGVISDAFPVDNEERRLPEWPTDGSPPSSYQREAARIRAALMQVQGAVEAAEGNLEKAEAAFGEAIDLWQRGYDRDHPESLPAILGDARLAVDRGEQAKEKRDVKTAASRGKKAERLLTKARQLLESSAVSASPQRAEWQELSDRVAALDPSSTDVSALDAAEKAAREALRSLSKYKTPGAPNTTRSAPAQ